tara:strand:- start:717 stop:821 length:105 start_codon:yes stop_codon:yes gene_type:complete
MRILISFLEKRRWKSLVKVSPIVTTGDERASTTR